MNGLARSVLKWSTMALVITAMLAMPRLPAVMATLWPGRIRVPRFSLAQLRVHFAGDVADARRFELLTQAEDRGQCWHGDLGQVSMQFVLVEPDS